MGQQTDLYIPVLITITNNNSIVYLSMIIKSRNYVNILKHLTFVVVFALLNDIATQCRDMRRHEDKEIYMSVTVCPSKC